MKPNSFSKVFGILALTLVVFQALFLGMDLQARDGKEAILDGILLAFWIFGLVFFYFMALRDQRMGFELEQSKKELDNSVKDLLGEILGSDHAGHKHYVQVADIENATRQGLSNIFDKVLDEVVGDKSPTTKDLPVIRNKFIKATGHDVKLEVLPFGLSVKITKEPIAKKKPATKKAPVKKPVAKAPAKKNVTTKKGK